MTREEYIKFGAVLSAKRGTELPHVKFTEADILEIRKNRRGLTRKQLAQLYGVHYRTIEKIHYFETWRHVR